MMLAAAPDRIDRHIDFLGQVHLVWAAFNAIVGAGALCFAASAAALGRASTDTAGTEIAAIATAGGFAALAVLSIVWALVHRYCGRALGRRRRIGRLLALGLAVGNALLIPLGTLVAGYALWVLLPDAARRRFEPEQ